MSSTLPSCDRPLIYSLPDELLVEIFTTVKQYKAANKATHPAFASSSSDIAAVRLTCRRFAATSSHLLVHYIRLDGINSWSLDKLESISHHCLLRQGVSVVRLEARCYATDLAEDIKEFAKWAVERVLVMARCYRRASEEDIETANGEDCNDLERQVMKRNEMARVLRKLKPVLETWSSISAEEWQVDPIHEPGKVVKKDWQDHMSSIQLLREAHDLYRRRYEEQEELRRDNIFASRFAAAMYRMHKAKCLEFQDFHHESSVCCLTCCDGEGDTHALGDVRGTDEYAGLLNIDSLLEPMSWDEIQDQHLGKPPAELLFTLPLALQIAGCKLESIIVRTTSVAENYYPLIRNSIHLNIAALGHAITTIGVKSFAFIHGMGSKAGMRETPALEDCEAFKEYIEAMTSSDNLERFRLALDSGWADGDLDYEEGLAFGSLVVPKSSRNLRDVHVTGLPLRSEELGSIYNILVEKDISLDFLTLSRIRVAEGTWTEALDILREMDITDKEVLEPTGAECESFIEPLRRRYERVFGKNPGQRNEAGRFINGEMRQNPFKCA